MRGSSLLAVLPSDGVSDLSRYKRRSSQRSNLLPWGPSVYPDVPVVPAVVE